MRHLSGTRRESVNRNHKAITRAKLGRIRAVMRNKRERTHAITRAKLGRIRAVRRNKEERGLKL